jgi:hypothetical protein
MEEETKREQMQDGLEVLSSDAQRIGARVAIVPLGSVDVRQKVDLEMDRLFRSFTAGLRAFLKIAGIEIHDVHIQWGYSGSRAAEVLERLQSMRLDPKSYVRNQKRAS